MFLNQGTAIASNCITHRKLTARRKFLFCQLNLDGQGPNNQDSGSLRSRQFRFNYHYKLEMLQKSQDLFSYAKV